MNSNPQCRRNCPHHKWEFHEKIRKHLLFIVSCVMLGVKEAAAGNGGISRKHVIHVNAGALSDAERYGLYFFF